MRLPRRKPSAASLIHRPMCWSQQTSFSTTSLFRCPATNSAERWRRNPSEPAHRVGPDVEDEVTGPHLDPLLQLNPRLHDLLEHVPELRRAGLFQQPV